MAAPPNGVCNYPFLTNSIATDATYRQCVGTPSDLGIEQTSVSGWEASGWVDNIHNHFIGQR